MNIQSGTYYLERNKKALEIIVDSENDIVSMYDENGKKLERVTKVKHLQNLLTLPYYGKLMRIR